MQVGVQPVVMRGVTVPHTADEHGVVPCVRVQVAPWLLASLLTLAVNGVLFNDEIAFTGISALVGEMEIVMASTVIAMVPVWAVSETEVATMVTPRSLAGGVVGAV
jgi:F0F1-type ATP synthase assembly protein I